ncbi:22831_t:CDS:2 [Entrophospora sp. SA101]|nr:9698_t:CDS:2 [Entrophospora sp. SA101]CAJ0763806.1 9288_t:CDS:2 [Entrophospora sp. SA101]CAJ0765447.1 22831_t:CDS:2 [Entrophospora sp. SA101]CAJ0831483.1 6185_t:CDS:2 [Entrophospora sp. SA101]
MEYHGNKENIEYPGYICQCGPFMTEVDVMTLYHNLITAEAKHPGSKTIALRI